MIAFQGLKKEFGTQVLFDDITFLVNPGERVGISGRNGHGKSTLFKILLGQEVADGGRIDIPKNYSIGHLEQHFEYETASVHEEACTVLEDFDGYKEEWKAEEILMGLGFSQEMMDGSPYKLSGGFQVRLNLAKALLKEPHMLVLDEPTNYLDITSARWLERFLCQWQGEMLIITHDRAFMDAVCTHIVAIHRLKSKKVKGTVAKLWETIALEEEVFMKTAANETKKREEVEKFISRFKAQASKAKQVQSRVKQLERAGEIQTLGPATRNLDFKFSHKEFTAKRVAKISNLSFQYNEDSPVLIDDLSIEIAKGERIAIIGPNGQGKTTLLNLIAGELTPTEGNIDFHPSVKTAYFGQTNVSRLNEKNNIVEEIMVTLEQENIFNRGVARTLAGVMMFSGDNALKKINVLSGGEKSRVLLAKILGTSSNLLLLDEPTNHLDMESVESLVGACEAYEGASLLVSHDENLLHAFATRLIVYDEGKVFVFEGTYADFLEKIGWAEEKK